MRGSNRSDHLSTATDRYKKYVAMCKKIEKEIQADRGEARFERGGYLVCSTKYGDKVINLCM